VKKVRDNDIDENAIDATLLSSILNMTLNKESFIFPLATYNWLWDNETLLMKVKVCDNGDCEEKTLFDIIKKKEYLEKTVDFLAYHFITSLPETTKKRLKLEPASPSYLETKKLFKNIILAAAN
jgi:hypothetical protein